MGGYPRPHASAAGLIVPVLLALGMWAAPAARAADTAPAVPAAGTGAATPLAAVHLGKINVTAEHQRPSDKPEAASAGVVPAQQVEATPAYEPGRILDTVPDLVVTQHSGEGKANQYFLRGFNLDHGTDIAISVAGMPVNEPTHAHGQGWADLNFLIPDLIGQISYKKGSYTAAQGDFSSAGSVDIDYTDTLPAGIAALGIGQYGFIRSLLADSFKSGGGNLLYALDVSHNNGPWTRPDNFHKLDGVLRYSGGDAAEGYALTAMGYTGSGNASNQIPERAVPQIGLYGSLNPRDGDVVDRYSGSADWHRTDDAGNSQAKLYVIKSDLSLYSDFTFFLDDPMHGDQFNQVDRRITSGGALEHTWSSGSTWPQMDNTLGLQLRNDDIDTGLLRTEDRARLSTVRVDHVVERSAGLYYSNAIQWQETFRSVLGLRGDFYRVHDDSANLGASGSTDARLLSPKLSLIFGPWDRTEYYLDFGDGFHSNDARGTLGVSPTLGEPQGTVPLLVRSRGYEAGLRTRAVPDLETSFALYRLDFDSELVFDGDAGTTSAGRPSRRTGIEWNSRYTPTAWLTLTANLAYARARFSDYAPVGEYIPEAIEGVGSLGLILDNHAAWYGSLDLEYFGPRPLIEDDSVRSRSTKLVNGQLGYRLSTSLQLQLDVFNALNSRDSQISYFYVSRLRGEPAAGVPDVVFHPLESRTVHLTFIYSF